MARRYPYAFPKGLRWEVFARDKQCILATLEPGHICRDVWGQVHAANNFDALTLEHVHRDGSMMGKRAPNESPIPGHPLWGRELRRAIQVSP